MAFGPEMHAPWQGKEIVLRSLEPADLSALPEMGRVAGLHLPPEYITEWDQLRTGPNSWAYRNLGKGSNLHWGIFVPGEGHDPQRPVGLVGYTGLDSGGMEPPQFRAMIAEDALLNRGVARAVYPLVTLSACEQGLDTVQALVPAGHNASVRALQRVGYFAVGTRPGGGKRHTELRQVLDVDMLAEEGYGLDVKARHLTVDALRRAAAYVDARSSEWPSAGQFTEIGYIRRSLS